MKRKTVFAVAGLALLISASGFASDASVDLGGSAVSRFAAQTDDGAVFINEQALSLSLEGESGNAYVYADAGFRIQNGASASGVFEELYAGWYGDFFDFRAGLQKIFWGKTDGVFITDLVSPLDLSSFLTADIEDLRIGVSGAKLDVYQGSHKLELVWLPVFTPSVTPSSGSLWAVAPAFPVPVDMQSPSMPETSLENSEYFSRYSWLGSILDVQLMGGWFWNDAPIPSVTGKTIVPGAGLTRLDVKPVYYRTSVVGAAVSAPVGPVILRSEGAWTFDKRYSGNIMVLSEGWIEKDAVTYMVGADVSFFGATVSVQWIQDIIPEYDDAILREESLESATCILQRTFFRETLKAEIFSIVNLDSKDAMIKPSITWLPGGGFELSVGGWFFIGESGQFGQYDDNDGVNARVAYYF